MVIRADNTKKCADAKAADEDFNGVILAKFDMHPICFQVEVPPVLMGNMNQMLGKD